MDSYRNSNNSYDVQRVDDNIMIMNTETVSNPSEMDYDDEYVTNIRVRPQYSVDAPSTGSFASLDHGGTLSSRMNRNSEPRLQNQDNGDRPQIRIICRIKPSKAEPKVQY